MQAYLPLLSPIKVDVNSRGENATDFLNDYSKGITKCTRFRRRNTRGKSANGAHRFRFRRPLICPSPIDTFARTIMFSMCPSKDFKSNLISCRVFTNEWNIIKKIVIYILLILTGSERRNTFYFEECSASRISHKVLYVININNSANIYAIIYRYIYLKNERLHYFFFYDTLLRKDNRDSRLIFT